jgi:glycogen phosphorylase
MVSNIFTTHTPVPAGIDIFSIEFMDKYFGSYYPKLKIVRDDFLGLGRKMQEIVKNLLIWQFWLLLCQAEPME